MSGIQFNSLSSTFLKIHDTYKESVPQVLVFSTQASILLRMLFDNPENVTTTKQKKKENQFKEQSNAIHTAQNI
jgi:hypothetical protein